MKQRARGLMVVVGLMTPFMLTGCGGGGGGLGGGSGTSDPVALLASISGPSSDSGSGGGVGGGTTSSSGVATVHHPEPASLALFGVGLACLAHQRRRKVRSS